jgi:hypothetical protein
MHFWGSRAGENDCPILSAKDERSFKKRFSLRVDEAAFAFE